MHGPSCRRYWRRSSSYVFSSVAATVLGCSLSSSTVMLAAWHPGMERSASAMMLCRVSRTDAVSVSVRAKSVSDSTRSPYRSPSCEADDSSCATSAIPSDLGWDIPGNHCQAHRMPQVHAVRAARISGMDLAENCGKAQGMGDGSAVGLSSEHRWLPLPQVT